MAIKCFWSTQKKLFVNCSKFFSCLINNGHWSNDKSFFCHYPTHFSQCPNSFKQCLNNLVVNLGNQKFSIIKQGGSKNLCQQRRPNFFREWQNDFQLSDQWPLSIEQLNFFGQFVNFFWADQKTSVTDYGDWKFSTCNMIFKSFQWKLLLAPKVPESLIGNDKKL